MTVSRLQRFARRLGFVGRQISQDLCWRHGGHWWRHRFVREPVDAGPERAARAGPTHRIVNPLLVRTTNDAVGGYGLLRIMLLHEAGNFGGNRRIMTYVDRLRRPRVRRGWVA